MASHIRRRIGSGVPARPSSAYQVGASKPAKPCCAKLFTPGTWRDSPPVVTASGRSVPARMCWLAGGTGVMNNGTSPDSAACGRRPAAAIGHVEQLEAATCCNSTMEMWARVPTPAVA